MARRDPDPLVARARAGEEAAWSELYARHAGRLEVWLRSLPPADAASSAEDVAAEAWMTAAEKLADFDGSADDFAGWLFTIARNLAQNRRRTAQRRATDPVAVDATGDPRFGTSDDPAARVAGEDHTRRLLQHLSPREAEVVACVDVVGLDAATTARVLGMSPTAVRVARHRALGRLRRLLDPATTRPDEAEAPVRGAM